MLYHLSFYLKHSYSFFNVFHYVSFRAIAGLLTALFFSFIFGSWFIEKSKIFFRAKAREWTPETHREKDNMPTMGGIFILAVVTSTLLLWCNLREPHVWIFLTCLLGFGFIGFLDDWQKIKYKKGISAPRKFLMQCTVAFMVMFIWFVFKTPNTTVTVPFFKHIHPHLELWFIPWGMLVLIGCSNAVNLTDGLDGLAIGALIPNFATFSVISYLAGHRLIANYLHIPYAGSSEIAVIGATLIGASLGFLWFNAYPAQIFMGDVGSLSLGAGLALMALMAREELLLPIAGGLFVIEAISVMMQVFSVKCRGKRIFRMAPLHHHFELIGWQESKITVRFGIITLILCLFAIITLKVR